MKRKIYVTFQKEGIHRFPAAATDPKLAEVSYLQFPHRHIFHFRVEIEVQHNDRDIEFILFKKWLANLYTGILELDYKSCEMIAEELISSIQKQYPRRSISVEVSEDGENGCRLEYENNSEKRLGPNDGFLDQTDYPTL